VAEATRDRFAWRRLDRIVTAGTTEILDVYEPLGGIDTLPRHAEFLDQWRQGHAAYVAGRFNAAIVCFRAAAALRPDDGPCRMFGERCAELMHRGLPPDWDGAWHFDKK
jgi:adenylate cyclase